MCLRLSGCLGFGMPPSPDGCCVLERMPRRCTSAPSASSRSRTCSWMKYVHACGAERRCVFLWVALDPLSKCIPVFQLGPRTHQMAHLLIHRLRALLAPLCLPVFTSDGLNAYYYALTA